MLCIPSVNGFMSPFVDGVIIGMKSVLENSDRMAELDHNVYPVPWRKDLFEADRKLTIGWYRGFQRQLNYRAIKNFSLKV